MSDELSKAATDLCDRLPYQDANTVARLAWERGANAEAAERAEAAHERASQQATEALNEAARLAEENERLREQLSFAARRLGRYEVGNARRLRTTLAAWSDALAQQPADQPEGLYAQLTPGQREAITSYDGPINSGPADQPAQGGVLTGLPSVDGGALRDPQPDERLWECNCGFAYSARHVDGDGGGYTCPNCADQPAQGERLRKRHDPIPALPGEKGRRYLCEDSDGQFYYLNHAATWQPCPDPFPLRGYDMGWNNAISEVAHLIGDKKDRVGRAGGTSTAFQACHWLWQEVCRMKRGDT